MKEGSGGGGGKRSESDKEKTRMRERQRRAITTNIFHGLRKHGGYRLSPRADINEVLRQLAHEAGWVIHPDGTTYRAKVSGSCPLCGALRKTAAAANPTPTGGAVIAAGGECSPMALGTPLSTIKAGSSLLYFPESLKDSCRQPIPVPEYTYQELSGEAQSSNGEGSQKNSDSGIGESSGMAMETSQGNHFI
ncbi:beta-amylase 7-like [Neltuma alba]|uniref:beta-amylase 7-like n=1 Tax=Neltuma alba TaxID=207710 RepID=UPI0010A547E6|nr:beta-amylase 7-like [Prosopis alba]